MTPVIRTNKVYLIVAAFLFSFGLITACIYDNTSNETQLYSSSLDKQFWPPKKLPADNELGFPAGTIVKTSESGSKVEFFPPEGYEFWEKTAAGWQLNQMSYSCEGNSVAGCDILYSNGSIGCTACEDGNGNTTSEPCIGSGYLLSNSFALNLIETGSFVSEEEAKGGQGFPAADELFFEIPRVKERIDQLYMDLYGTTQPDPSKSSSHQRIFNLYGYHFGMGIIEEQVVNPSLLASLESE